MMDLEVATESEQAEHIEALIAELRLEEKVAMLSGHGFFEQIVKDEMRYCASLYHIGAGNERLGIPEFFFMDGPRGVDIGHSTCFPVSMARGASFDVDLERRVGDAIGREMRAHGANLFGGVCINLLRHPAWGRAQETYGEDPFLLGEMGVALTKGVQHHNVVATPKHYAANSMENARFTVDVKLDERALREVYLPHFKRCIDAGAGAVMSAYNQVNGAYCGHNRALLIDILKNEWGFDGFVYSDFVMGCRGWDAMPAGLDVEAPDTRCYGAELVAAVERGDIEVARIDDAVRRVLRSLLRILVAEDPESYSESAIACDAHVALARECAEKSIVLLRNEDVLPLDAAKTRRLLVLGPLAAKPNLGDHGSSRVFPPHVVTPLAGLEAYCGDRVEVVHDEGKDLAHVRELATEADAVLVVAGYTHLDEGEFIIGETVDLRGDPKASIGGDRLELTLGDEQEALILAAVEGNPRTVVAVMSGSAVLMEAWRERVAGILMLWYPGMQGGEALARVLFGDVDPSGRLPFSVPKSADELPFFDRDATAITYDLWHGYTKLERDGVEPAFPFGFGLSYTRYAFSNATASVDEVNDRLVLGIDVENRGERCGTAVVQAYAGWAEADVDQPRKRLCAFGRVDLDAGEKERIELEAPLRQLAFFDVDGQCWRLGATAWRVQLGASSADADGVALSVDLPDRSYTIAER